MDRSYQERIAVLEEKLASLEKAMLVAQAANALALLKAEEATKTHFFSINEQRGQIKDYVATVPTRLEMNSKIDSLSEKISEITDRTNKQTGTHQGLGLGWSILIGAIGIISSVIVIINMFKD